MNEPLDYLSLRNKERLEQWKERLKEYRETHHGRWVEYKENPVYEIPTYLRMKAAL